jgi:Kef-type K+ transport system membrane component KefB
MNARGLIELILLNIGLEAGIITPTLFTILVLVAIGTTLMATPVFEFVYGRHRQLQDDAGMASADAETAPEAAFTEAGGVSTAPT